MKATRLGAVATATLLSLVAGCSSSDGGKSGNAEGDGDGGPAGGAASEGAGGTGNAAGGGGQVSPGGKPGNGGAAPGAGGATQGAGGTPGAASGSRVSFDGTAYEAAIIARNVTPGDEQHVCVVVELPNESPIWVNSIDADLSGGSHHMIVDRYSAGTGLELEPTPCAPTMASDDTRLMIAQQPHTDVDLPEGVAFALVPHQHVFLQLHYLNSGDERRDIEGKIRLNVVTSAEPPVEAKSIFTGSFSIFLQPNAAGSAQNFFVPVPERGTRHVFALTSHTHKLGVKSTIERVASENAPASTPIHTSTDWSEPPLTFFTPTLDFTGTDGLRLVCNYQNTTNNAVSFGTATTDEMCFMWVYYFDR